MKTVNPYLNFPGNTEEAFTFYKSVFGGEFADLVRFGDMGDNPMEVPDRDLDKIAHIALPLGKDTLLMATDNLESWEPVQAGNNFYIHLEAESGEEADRLFERLSAGGSSDMPMQKTKWAEKFGQCTDRFGVRWMVMFTGNVQFP